jgi:hypothetical protein
LVLPEFTKPFTIDTDAYSRGIGAVLSQYRHPVAYISKALGPKAQALSTYGKECMAVILAVTKWKPYLQHMEFTIAHIIKASSISGKRSYTRECSKRLLSNCRAFSTSFCIRRDWRTRPPMHYLGSPSHQLYKHTKMVGNHP